MARLHVSGCYPLFTALSMVAEFEADLARMRTREGMAIAKAKGRLRGKKPKLSPHQEAHLVELHRAGRHTTTELAELFNIARSTVYRAIHRAGNPSEQHPTD
jgi:DNA invertase Pin-like site-specific DNA recombinase